MDSKNLAEKSSTDSENHPIQASSSLPSIDPAKEERLRRKLDFTLIPIATLCWTLVFLDRGNIGNAKSAGLEKDLGLHTYDFNIGTSLFYITYLILEVPYALLIKRVGFIVVPLAICSFGIVTTFTAFIQGRGGFFATRICLALTEAAVFPGLSYMMTRFYRRHELTSRMGGFMNVAGGCAGGFGGLLAAGLLRLGHIGSRTSWRNIFLVEGIITTVIGLILLRLFPSDPERTRLFTEEERKLAIARIYADQPQIKDTKERMNSKLVKRSIFDVTVLACAWLYIVDNVSVQGLGIFLPSILRINYPEASTVEIQLLVVPVYLSSSVIALSTTIACIKTKMHWPFALFGGVLTIIGYGIWIATDASAKKARYAACFLNMTGGFINGPVVIGWAASNASPDTLRATVGAVVTAFGGLGSIAGVWAYVQTDAASGYHKGNSFNLAMAASLCVCVIGLFLYQRYENHKRDLGARDYRLEGKDVDQLGNLHPSFRYIH